MYFIFIEFYELKLIMMVNIILVGILIGSSILCVNKVWLSFLLLTIFNKAFNFGPGIDYYGIDYHTQNVNYLRT